MTFGFLMVIVTDRTGYMILMVVIGIVFILWGWRSGQFRNIEEPKYRMLDEKEPEPWPRGKAVRVDSERLARRT